MRRLALVSLVLAAALAAGCASRGSLAVEPAAGTRTAAPVPAGAPGAPLPAPVPAASAPARTVQALPGDSLWTLSRRCLGTGFRWTEIAAANHLVRPWTIATGQRIEIPAAQGRTPKAVAPPLDEARAYGWKPVPNAAYAMGERLTFAVQYGMLTAGYATLSIPAVVQREGRPVFHVMAEARSLPFFDAFFRVDDRLDSYIDTDYGFSWGYEKHLQEGRFRADAIYDYDQRRGLMLEPAKGTQAPMPIGSQDVLSCFYYFRTQPLIVGSVLSIPVTADDKKSYVLSVDVLRKERVSTLAGAFYCLVVQPHLTFNGVFRQKGEVTLWITDDERRLPVLIRSKIIIGSININLQRVQWVQPAKGTANERVEKKGP